MTHQLPIPTLQPTMRVLSDAQIQAIHSASLTILATTGVDIQDQQVQQLLLDAGGWEADGRTKIPEKLVTDALASTPTRILLHDRLGNLAMPLELGKVYFGPGSDATFTLDLESGERRRTVADDVERFARLTDALPNLDFVMSMGNPVDVPPDDVYLHEFIRMIRGSSKPIVYTVKDAADLADLYRLGVAITGSEQTLREKPFFLLYPEPISPLLMNAETLQKVVFCAEHWLPTGFIPSTNTGGGGPITMAGAIALGNAECLLGLVIAQLVQPGAPFLYGFNTSALDMKTSIVSYGCPEWSLTMGAISDMAHYYGLPVWGYAGASDSKRVDAQFGAEAMFSIMSAFLSQTTVVHDVGFLEFGSTSALEALVVANELIDMTRFMVAGIDVNPTTLALDAIASVRPGAGFLAEDHTLDNWTWAQWKPDLLDRNRYQRWEKLGSKDLFARANERARQLLVEHEVAPLPDGVETEIAAILAERAAN